MGKVCDWIILSSTKTSTLSDLNWGVATMSYAIDRFFSQSLSKLVFGQNHYLTSLASFLFFSWICIWLIAIFTFKIRICYEAPNSCTIDESEAKADSRKKLFHDHEDIQIAYLKWVVHLQLFGAKPCSQSPIPSLPQCNALSQANQPPLKKYRQEIMVNFHSVKDH